MAQQVDHVQPLYKGGTDAVENLQSLCIECHSIKTLKDKGYKARGCDARGMPIDVDHCWYGVRSVDPIELVESISDQVPPSHGGY